MEALVTADYFRFFPDKFYLQLYVVGYNEYLKAVAVLRETLLGEFPERKEEVEKGCGEMLSKFSDEYDGVFKNFASYCAKNLFVVPNHVPVYDLELEKVEENRLAHEAHAKLQHTVMANEYFNSQLKERLRTLKDGVKERKALLAKVANTEWQLEVLNKCDALEQRIHAAVQLPEHLPEQELEM